jgi:hypothetical protein
MGEGFIKEKEKQFKLAQSRQLQGLLERDLFSEIHEEERIIMKAHLNDDAQSILIGDTLTALTLSDGQCLLVWGAKEIGIFKSPHKEVVIEILAKHPNFKGVLPLLTISKPTASGIIELTTLAGI